MKPLKFELESAMFTSNPNVKSVAVLLPVNMSAKAAWLASIQKWEFIIKSIKNRKPHQLITDGGTESCGLCHKYQWVYDSNACVTCPVKLKNGEGYCHETPYVLFARATDRLREFAGVDKPLPKYWVSNQLEAAKAELKFLKSLKVK